MVSYIYIALSYQYLKKKRLEHTLEGQKYKIILKHSAYLLITRDTVYILKIVKSLIFQKYIGGINYFKK